MAITRQKKEELLVELKNIISDAVSVAFVHFKGLNVHEANELRASLKKEGVRYMVTKKTLLKKTFVDTGVAGDLPSLDGEVAFAYLPSSAGEDMTAPARNLHEFVGKFKNKLTFLGGIVDKRFVSKTEVETIASIPPTPVLRGMFVNIINSPIQRMAIALSEVAKKKA